MLICPDTPLIFMHIPKTAGISLYSALARYWGPATADLYNISARNPRAALDLIGNRQKAVYCGHFAFGLHRWFERPVVYASIVREPVARVVSLYHYCLPLLRKFRELAQAKGMGARELFATYDLPDAFADFADWIDEEQTAERFFACASADLDNGMVRRFSGVGLAPGPCPDSALEQARQNIEQYFSVVGLLERYGETLDLLSRRLAVPPLEAVHRNKGTAPAAREVLAPALLARIAAANRLDTELYRWIAARFDADRTADRPAIRVAPGPRDAGASIPLWLAVGDARLRELLRRNRVLPGVEQSLECVALTQLASRQGGVVLGMNTRLSGPRMKDLPANPTQIHFTPQQAKQLLVILRQAIKAYEQTHGTIPPPPSPPPT